ncbi:MAG: hypothetical protein JST66_14805 [Bacteroidetes bacterium]|nr:hypothetical protein [Bacteroidota bacterium]
MTMRRLLGKCITAYARLRWWRVPPEQLVFLRQGCVGRLYQLRYWWRDRITRAPYRTITWDGEFSPELKFVLPYAYWHHLNGTLDRTVSSRGTRALYFFSPRHEERFTTRRWNDFDFPAEIPNAQDHSFRYDLSKWAPVPYKARFAGLRLFDRPTVVIANRYNSEWGGPPVSFFSLDDLRTLFTLLAPHYQVIYNRPSAARIVNDESAVLDLGDKPMVRAEFPGVVLLEDLMDHPAVQADDLNHLQLLVYAECERFLSIHGGTATLASCFGGTNIILSRKGQEHFFGEFRTIYPKLSGARIFAHRDMDTLLTDVRRHFVPAP